MTLVNTNGLVLIGPGSEWFWTALSGMVLAVTFVALYRQLRLQRAANALNAMEALGRRWESRDLVTTRLEAALAMRAPRQPGLSIAAIARLLDFLTDVIGLWDRGMLDDEDVVPTWGQATAVWLELVRPYVEEQRAANGAVLYSDVDTFVAHVRELTRRSWRRRKPLDLNLPSINDANRNEWLDEAIRRTTSALELLDKIESRVPIVSTLAKTAEPVTLTNS